MVTRRFYCWVSCSFKTPTLHPLDGLWSKATHWSRTYTLYIPPTTVTVLLLLRLPLSTLQTNYPFMQKCTDDSDVIITSGIVFHLSSGKVIYWLWMVTHFYSKLYFCWYQCKLFIGLSGGNITYMSRYIFLNQHWALVTNIAEYWGVLWSPCLRNRKTSMFRPNYPQLRRRREQLN